MTLNGCNDQTLSPIHNLMCMAQKEEEKANVSLTDLTYEQNILEDVQLDLNILNNELIQAQQQAKIRQYTDIGIKVVGGLLFLYSGKILFNKLKT